MAARARPISRVWRIIVEPNDIESPKSEFQPKPLTLRQNIVLTLKIAGAGAAIALLWLGSVYTAR